jgi:hypothetical protein
MNATRGTGHVSLSSRRWLQSKWSINFELFSEKIPSIQRNQRIVVATFWEQEVKKSGKNSQKILYCYHILHK